MGPRSQPLCYFQQLFWLDVRVSEEMCLEVGSLIKTSLTDWTSVWSFLVVKYFVNGQGSVLAETLATIITLERLLFAVYVAMVPEI